jgi:hypothetical protein
MSYAPIAMPTGSHDTITLLSANTLLVSLKPSTPEGRGGVGERGGGGGKIDSKPGSQHGD